MNPYLLSLRRPDELSKEFEKIRVDWGGADIMVPKGTFRLIRVSSVRSFAANILKQELLSLGGDVAVSRDSITGRAKTTACVLLATDSQLARLVQKLDRQPWGLSELGRNIQVLLERVNARGCRLIVGKETVTIGQKTLLMGILNVTPDSFSGDGLCGATPEEIVDTALRMESEGADIIDIGAESTRPGARRISAAEEINRLRPFLKKICRILKKPVSVDTTKSEVARMALDSGVRIINDITALRGDRKMGPLIARAKACIVLMHMKGTPRTMQTDPRYQDLMGEIMEFFSDAIGRAQEAGIRPEKIIVDPGLGFGKTFAHNLEILDRLSELRSFGRPVLAGMSRKRFIGHVLDQEDPRQRVWGTAAALALAVANGADIVRVHDVSVMKQVASMADAITRREITKNRAG